MLEKLTFIVGTLKETHGTAEGFETAGETAAFAYQAGKITAQIGIDTLDIVGQFFPHSDLVRVCHRIHQVTIHQATVACVLTGFGTSVENALRHFPREAATHRKAEQTMSGAVYKGGDIHKSVFFWANV